MIHNNGIRTSETSSDAEQYGRLNEDEVAQLVDNLCTAVGAIAGNDADAFAILAEAAVAYFADNLYEGDRDQDIGFILATVEDLFMEQADFHDEVGLYMGEYVIDQPSDGCLGGCGDGYKEDRADWDPEDDPDCDPDYDYDDDPDEIVNYDPGDCSYGIPEGEECLGCPRCPDCPGSIKRYVVDGGDIHIVMVRRG